MLKVKTDESFWEYCGRENFIVLPITSHVRKDGGLVFVSKEAKEAMEKYPELQKIWGYLIQNQVQTPTFRRTGVNLIGVIDRGHYASNPDEDLVEQGLYLLKEVADSNPGYLFYLPSPIGGEAFLDKNESILKGDRFILLREEEATNE